MWPDDHELLIPLFSLPEWNLGLQIHATTLCYAEYQTTASYWVSKHSPNWSISPGPGTVLFKRTILMEIMMRDYVLIPPFLEYKSCDLGENWGQMHEKRGA